MRLLVLRSKSHVCFPTRNSEPEATQLGAGPWDPPGPSVPRPPVPAGSDAEWAGGGLGDACEDALAVCLYTAA